MFRDGASEYEINGSSCRLMDVQELLSDSGIGREMHVIVGQGQLAAILESKPEERRAFIEEAAGVLKHRKRKEKALRKLDAMQANLTRLTDLTAELRRQLKPLGKQAEIARRAQAVQAELRDARLRLLADDLVSSARRAGAGRGRRGQRPRPTRSEVEQALQVAQPSRTSWRQRWPRTRRPAAAAQDTWYRLSALAERLRGTVRLAAERARHLADRVADARPAGRDPEELDAEAEQAAEREAELAEAVAEAARRARRDHASGAPSWSAPSRPPRRRTWPPCGRSPTAAKGLARLAGQVEALRSKTSATADEIERLSTVLAEARDRAELAAE